VVLIGVKDQFGFMPGTDMSEFYPEWRKKHGAGEKDNADDAINAIRTRQMKEGELPKEETDRDLTPKEMKAKLEREKKARKAYEAERKKREKKIKKK
jgi:hypothetical protein